MDADPDREFAWLDAAERLAQVQHTYAREPMIVIRAHAIYVSATNFIARVATEMISLDGSGGIPGAQLLAVIQAHKVAAPSGAYRLADMLLYNVDLASEHIQQYAAAADVAQASVGFLRAVPAIAERVAIADSVFVFHDINCLYMIYQERAPARLAPILKSAGKPCGGAKTRRVAFLAPLIPRAARHTRHTPYRSSTASEAASEVAPADTAAAISSGDARRAPPCAAGGASSAPSSSAT